MRKIVSILVVFFLFALGAIGSEMLAGETNSELGSSFAGYVPNQIVVKFNTDALSRLNLKTARENGLTGISAVDQVSTRFSALRLIQKFPHARQKMVRGRMLDMRTWFKVTFADSVDADAVVNAYKALADIIDAQPIGIHNIYKVPNDPNFIDQWHLNQANDHDIDAPEAWDILTGNPDIIVTIMDSGVRYFHKDLGGSNASYDHPENTVGNIDINWAEKNGTPGVDDDGNGYIDDWVGWDFVEVNPLINNGDDYHDPDNDPRDFNGHGTHCAGIVAAINNNGYAVSSPAGGWGETNGAGNGVKVLPLRIGWDIRITGQVGMDFAASAFVYAADNGARIASCSWGSSNTGGLGDAMDYFLYDNSDQVRLIFKAAGNDNDEASDYMLDRSDVIGVASTDENDVKSSFSTYGAFVDISAPGSNIVSTYHDHTNPAGDYIATLSGTSMATPLAAGVAALIWSANPSLTALDVQQILYNNADDIYSIPGNAAYAGKLGAGRVNAFTALQDPSLPVELVSFTASTFENQIQLRWTTASEVSNAGFEIYRSAANKENFKKIASYENHPELVGQGSSNKSNSYSYIDGDVVAGGNYYYKLADVSYSGERKFSHVIEVRTRGRGINTLTDAAVPNSYELQPAFPNPFNPSTRIKFGVPQNSLVTPDQVSLTVYDNLGRKVRELYAGNLLPGYYETEWNGRNSAGQPVASGLYFIVYTGNYEKLVQKVMLIK